MKIVLVLVASLAAAAVAAEHTSYEGYKVFQLHLENNDQIDLIRSFSENASFDFWSAPKMIGLPTTVMVAPLVQGHFVETLNKNAINYTLLIENVESTVQNERFNQAARTSLAKGKISFSDYHRYEVIQDYLSELAANYPDIVSLEDIGASYEGRSISMIKIGAGDSNNPIILIDGGIHAREWITPAVVLYLIQELVENENNRNMIENINWYIIPVLNPDGYEFTHTDDRLWRKTRSEGSICPGVDANRNFDFHWYYAGESLQCIETYPGPSAFSESETVALKNVVEQHADQIKLYLTFHSYGNYLMYPWSYTSALPDDVDELYALAVDVDAAIASVAGTRYKIGTPTQLLYMIPGTSLDWVKGVGGVALSYAFELTGGGSTGFDLPASEILAVGIETFEGIKVYKNYIEENYVNLR